MAVKASGRRNPGFNSDVHCNMYSLLTKNAILSSMYLLHDPVTWYKICHAVWLIKLCSTFQTKATSIHWDIQDKDLCNKFDWFKSLCFGGYLILLPSGM